MIPPTWFAEAAPVYLAPPGQVGQTVVVEPEAVPVALAAPTTTVATLHAAPLHATAAEAAAAAAEEAAAAAADEAAAAADATPAGAVAAAGHWLTVTVLTVTAPVATAGQPAPVQTETVAVELRWLGSGWRQCRWRHRLGRMGIQHRRKYRCSRQRSRWQWQCMEE